MSSANVNQLWSNMAKALLKLEFASSYQVSHFLTVASILEYLFLGLFINFALFPVGLRIGEWAIIIGLFSVLFQY